MAAAKLDNGTLAPLNEGSGDKHINVDIYVPADMAAHIALEGQGGTRDKHKHFCTHCNCKLKHRHRPFELIKVEADTTVAKLASELDMPVSLLWAVNAGVDFDGMFTTDELQENTLGDITLPLRVEAAVADPVDVPVAPEPVRGGAKNSVDNTDLGYGNASAASRKRKSEAAKKAQEEDRPGKIPPKSPLREAAVKVESVDEAKSIGVTKGTVVRVVQTHKMDRRSQFVDQFLVLDRER